MAHSPKASLKFHIISYQDSFFSPEGKFCIVTELMDLCLSTFLEEQVEVSIFIILILRGAGVVRGAKELKGVEG